MSEWIEWPSNFDDYHSPPHDKMCFVKLRIGEVIGPQLVSSHFDIEGGVGGWYCADDEFDIVAFLITNTY